MSVAEDVVSFRSFTEAVNTTTHTPVGTPVGVLVFIAQNLSTVDRITSVTYGGVPMQRVRFIADATGAGDLGAAYVYILGSGVPSGAQSLVITNTGGTDAAWCITFTGTTRLGISASASTGVTVANPSLTLPTNADYDGIVYAVAYSGAPLASVSAGSGYTAIAGSAAGGHDFTTSSAILESDGLAGANVVASYTCVSDDVAFIAVAVTSPPQSQQFLVKDTLFVQRETQVKIGGTFTTKVRKVKIGGSFV